MRFILLAVAAAAAVPSIAAAQTASPLTPRPVTTLTTTENFNTLAPTGSSNILPPGFQIVETGGTAADGFYAAGTGSSNAGNTYSFGAAGSTERALGALTSGGVSTIMFGGIFTNALGATITSLALGYTGEQWRFADAANALLFDYSTDATTLQNGNWTRAPALDFAAIVTSATTQGPLDGNQPANQRQIAGTLAGLTIANGGNFGLRFTQRDVTGSDPGLAIDDLSFTARLAAVSAVPEPGTWAMLLLGFLSTGTLLRRRKGPASVVA